MEGEDGRAWYHLHIPKTAGSSFWAAIEACYPRVLSLNPTPPKEGITSVAPFYTTRELAEVVQRDPGELAKHAFFGGHFGHSLIPLLPAPPRVLTMLREPVSRLVSHYNHRLRAIAPRKADSPEIPGIYTLRRAASNGRWDIPNVQRPRIGETSGPWVGETSDLAANFSHEPMRRFLRSFQVRNITLDFDLTQPVRDRAGRELNPNLGTLLAYAVPQAEDGELLEQAKQNLAGFDFFGIAERFEESMELMCATFGWKPKWKAPRLNTAPADQLRFGDLPPEIQADIESLSEVDAELYRFATQLFEERLAAMRRRGR